MCTILEQERPEMDDYEGRKQTLVLKEKYLKILIIFQENIGKKKFNRRCCKNFTKDFCTFFFVFEHSKPFFRKKKLYCI